ncbi:hypothetical protein ACEPAH_1671 [Sanghuangporus vaninii]
MGLIFSKTSILREDAQIEAARAAMAAGRPLDGEGTGIVSISCFCDSSAETNRIQYEAKNPEMKFGAGMRKSARKAEKKKTKKAKKEERKEAKKVEKAKKEAQKIAKIRNDRRGAVDLLEGEDIGHVVG